MDAIIKNKMLYVNKVPQKQHIHTPTVQDLFNILKQEMERMEKIEFQHTAEIVDKGSVFRGHAMKVKNSTDIRSAYKRIRLLYLESNHIMMAYAVKTYTGAQDDGEYTASKRMLNILTESGRNNTVVFITREYGGTHLGPRRFIHIKRATRDAIQALYPV